MILQVGRYQPSPICALRLISRSPIPDPNMQTLCAFLLIVFLPIKQHPGLKYCLNSIRTREVHPVPYYSPNAWSIRRTLIHARSNQPCGA